MIGYWPKMFIGGYHKLMPLIRHDVIGGASWPAGGSSGGLRGGQPCHCGGSPPIRCSAGAGGGSELWRLSSAPPRRGYGRAAALVPLVVPPHRMRALRRERYAAETHMTIADLGYQRGDLLARMRHDGCGG